ncbi:hypothetical protein GGS21DRAFT_192943 [Xylaria nigripes]|nr:hypothetical protein GGS21DRAFT_192943 [Xylaria nigripes]
MLYKFSIQRRLATLMSTSHDSNDKLHQKAMVDSKPACLGLSESSYILYRNTGPQSASAAYNGLKLQVGNVGRCELVHTDKQAGTKPEHQSTQQGIMNYAQRDQLHISRLHLYDAAEQVQSRSCDNVNPGSSISSGPENLHTPPHGRDCHVPCVREYQSGVLRIIRSAWQKILDHGGNSECGPMTTRSFASKDLDDGDWDDTDVPITLTNAPLNQNSVEPGLESDFDLFDDMIEEEFPRIKQALREPVV